MGGVDFVDTHFYRIGERSPENKGKADFVEAVLDPHFHKDIVVFDRESFVNYSAGKQESYRGICHVLDATVALNCDQGMRTVATITGRAKAVASAKSKIEGLTDYNLIEIDPRSSGRDIRCSAE